MKVFCCRCNLPEYEEYYSEYDNCSRTRQNEFTYIQGSLFCYKCSKLSFEEMNKRLGI